VLQSVVPVKPLSVLLPALCLALTAARAQAGIFAAPVRLPLQANLDEAAFAVNDNGEGVVVEGSNRGEQVFPISTAGILGSPTELPGPADTQIPQQVALGQQGRVALISSYFDGTSPGSGPGCVEHCGGGCCAQPEIASWQSGEAPTPFARIGPIPSSAAHELTRWTFIVGPNALTVLWVRADVSFEDEGREEEPPENAPLPNQSQLEEAYARFGGPLHVKRLATAPKGIYHLHLGLATNGAPIASWIEDGNKLITMRGTTGGDVSGPMHVRYMPSLTELQGFDPTTSDESTVAYLSKVRHHNQLKLLVMTSVAGQRFSPARRLAVIPETVEPYLRPQETPQPEAKVARRGRMLLAVWARTLGEGRVQVRRGNVSGHLGPVESLGLGNDIGAFIDAQGRSVIIYHKLTPLRRTPGKTASTSETFGVTALPNRPFGRPLPLYPHHDCKPNLEHRTREPLAVSQNGHALISLDCENEDYVVGYAPS
jgi:hypothetical protein